MRHHRRHAVIRLGHNYTGRSYTRRDLDYTGRNYSGRNYIRSARAETTHVRTRIHIQVFIIRGVYLYVHVTSLTRAAGSRPSCAKRRAVSLLRGGACVVACRPGDMARRPMR